MAKKLRPLEPRNLALVADLELEGAWRVEFFDSDGAGYIAIFAGQSAELRARDCYDAIERGALLGKAPGVRLPNGTRNQRAGPLLHRS